MRYFFLTAHFLEFSKKPMTNRYIQHSLRTLRIVAAGLATLSSLSTYASEQTLLDIYALAKQNDHEFKSDQAEYLASKEVAAINKAALLPQITGTGAASYTHTDSHGTTPQESQTENINYGVSLTQNIINTNASSTYQQGKVEAELAEVNYQADQQSLIIRSAQAYFNVLRALDQLETAKAEEKAQATLLEQTQQRYEVGLISINDVYETHAAYDSAVANAISAQASLGIQYDSLTVLTGEFHTAITPLKDSFEAIPLSPNTQQDWVDTAIENNYSLRASELSAQAAMLNAKAVRSNHHPTLSGTVSYTDTAQDTDIENGANTGSDSGSAVFSLNLNIPLYSGGRLSAQERQAAQNSISAQETFLFTRRSTVQNTRSLFLSVTTDIAQVKARKQAIVSNESALEATKAGYDAGTRDIVDVVNAQRNLFQAQRDYFDSLYNYIVNTLLLKEVVGKLQVKDLEELEQFLANNR